MDVTLHWITLRQIGDDEFSQSFLTSFDYQIICNNVQNMTANLIGDQTRSIDYRYPDYAVINCDNKPHLELTVELLFMGQLIDSDERWEFYKAENFERPSNAELKYLKGIIIPSSSSPIKNKVPKDENLIKQFLKRGGNNMNNQSEIGLESSLGSDSGTNFDFASLNKQAMNIIGDDLIPQNETWIEKLADFIRDVYHNHKHIKLVGCQFGS
mmetsp:Transcript_36933/g.56557  ORF Transcript_36933/g.56557 Transcript_36933/m.56557 type:complete len:212 (-) Transcript_36933:1676-2311(-)